MHGPKNVGSKTANGSKIVGLRFGDHETKDMLRVVGQQCCVHLHGKDMLGIVVQQFCFRVHGSYTREHHSPQLTEKKNRKRHKPSGDVRGVYDVILYGCAVILFSSGRQVSRNCKIKVTRKSLLSDFSRIKKH